MPAADSIKIYDPTAYNPDGTPAVATATLGQSQPPAPFDHVPVTSRLPADMTSFHEDPVTSYPTGPLASYDQQPMTSYPMELVTSYPAEPVTSYPTEPVTSYPTEAVTSYPTEPVTSYSTKPVTSYLTGAVTSYPTEAVTSYQPEPMASSYQTESMTSHSVEPVTSYVSGQMTSYQLDPLTQSGFSQSSYYAPESVGVGAAAAVAVSQPAVSAGPAGMQESFVVHQSEGFTPSGGHSPRFPQGQSESFVTYPQVDPAMESMNLSSMTDFAHTYDPAQSEPRAMAAAAAHPPIPAAGDHQSQPPPGHNPAGYYDTAAQPRPAPSVQYYQPAEPLVSDPLNAFDPQPADRTYNEGRSSPFNPQPADRTYNEGRSSPFNPQPVDRAYNEGRSSPFLEATRSVRADATFGSQPNSGCSYPPLSSEQPGAPSPAADSLPLGRRPPAAAGATAQPPVAAAGAAATGLHHSGSAHSALATDLDRSRLTSFDTNYHQEEEEESRRGLVVTPSVVPEEDVEPEAVTSMWLWAPDTQRAISRFLLSPSTFALPRDQVTMHGGVVEIAPLGDPVQELLGKYTAGTAPAPGASDVTRRPVTASNVTQDEAGLRTLIANENWRAAVELTERLLTTSRQQGSRGMAGNIGSNNREKLRLWHTRFMLLVKLKMFSSAEAEMEPFGDFERVDLSYEYNPHMYPGSRGSMVPFSLRQLWADLPGYSGKYSESLDRVSRLLGTVERMVAQLEIGCDCHGDVINDQQLLERALRYWRDKHLKLLYSLANCFVLLKDYCSAFELFDLIEVKESPESLPAMLSAVGRTHLQLGDVRRALTAFKRVESLCDGDEDEQVLMNRGLLLLCQSKYKDALHVFEKMVANNPNNAVGWNNLAVTHMYLGRMRDAVSALEGVIRGRGEAGGGGGGGGGRMREMSHESLVSNLSVLYGGEGPKSLGKKILLLEHVAKVKGDSFRTASLRFP